MLAPNSILRERYRIISQLGHGGMGAVYQAMDMNLNCLVAVKETFATNEEQRRAFRREAELLANLSHPTLPRVMDHFTEEEGQFLVMQFVPGHDLAQLLELREQPFPVAKVLDWADQILDALEELHSSSPPIIHRDIKPANLKVTPKGKILLLDFGLAKGSAGQMSTVDDNSRGKSIYGYTPNYSPIEQIRGAGTDPRSDLYSLAATMWTLLTAKVPPDALSRLAEKEEGNPDPLRPAQELNSHVPAAVSSALDQAMAVNRSQRYATTADLREALGEARDAKFESPTRSMVDARAAEPPPVRPLKPISKTPERETSQPVPPLTPSVKSSQPEVLKPSPGTLPMRVDSARVVLTREGIVATPIGSQAPRESRKRVSMIAAAVLAVAVIAIALAFWRPWSSVANLNNRNSSLANDGGARNDGGAINANSTSIKAGLPIELVRISPGSFVMGSKNGGEADEKPAHQVTINYSFYIGKYEVTQAQWQAVMGNNPSVFKDCANCPVEQVSWDDTQKFMQQLNRTADGYTYRLPTEAEWEYVCRADSVEDYGHIFVEMAWHKENSGNKTHTVGGKQPNAWGVADMYGNVWEWCQDLYHTTYDGAPTDGNAWVNLEETKYRNRVMRGGSSGSSAKFLRCANRDYVITSEERSRFRGFRVVAVR